MPTVSQVIHRLLPTGTRVQEPGAPYEPDWSTPPVWPDDDAGLRRLSAALGRLLGGPSRVSPQSRRRSATLCLLVPPEECCVQPKARTPQVGCNLQTLSLHLALLPPLGNVTTRHRISPAPLTGSRANLLLVPFPYAVADDILFEQDAHPDEEWARFGVAAPNLAVWLGRVAGEAAWGATQPVQVRPSSAQEPRASSGRSRGFLRVVTVVVCGCAKPGRSRGKLRGGTDERPVSERGAQELPTTLRGRAEKVGFAETKSDTPARRAGVGGFVGAKPGDPARRDRGRPHRAQRLTRVANRIGLQGHNASSRPRISSSRNEGNGSARNVTSCS